MACSLDVGKFFANFLSQRILKRPYLTHIYSRRELTQLISEVGFSVERVLTAFDNYENPETIIDITNNGNKLLEHYYDQHRLLKTAKWKKILWKILLKSGQFKNFVPSFIMLSRK